MAAPERWWILTASVVSRGQQQYRIVESPSRPPDGPVSHVAAGPFGTKAQAEKALNKLENPPLPGGIHLPNPFAPLTDIGKIGHWVGDFVLHLTDGAMWRSIGWLLLGAWLVIAGIYLWFRTSSTYENLQSAVLGSVKAL